MEFKVPQFIDYESKILGPFNIKQTIFIGIAGAICFVLYFSIGQENFFLFIIVSIILIGIALALGFLKIQGQDLPTILKNFLNFSAGPKIYLWKRKEYPVFLNPEKEEKPKEKEQSEESLLKITQKSKLKELNKKIEFGP